MRRGHISVGIQLQLLRLQRKILQNLPSRGMSQGIAALQLPVRIVGRDRHDVRPDLKEGLKALLPLRLRQRQIIIDQQLQ